MINYLPCYLTVKCRLLSWMKPIRHDIRAQMSNVNVGAGSYGEDEANSHGERLDTSSTGDPNKLLVFTLPLFSLHFHATSCTLNLYP